MISYTPPQLEWLETEAQRLSISVPELRRIIDAARGATK
jgi:hypothetical protein